jgi:hypothetical protein
MAAELKDSGARQSFASGAVRDTATGKPRLALLPPWALFAWGWIMDAGAIKYAARNWEKGMPITRYLESAKRHIEAYMAGFRDEPHLWQALWNIGGAVHTQILVYIGAYPAEFYDVPNHLNGDRPEILSQFEKTRVDAMMKSSKDPNPTRPGGLIEVSPEEYQTKMAGGGASSGYPYQEKQLQDRRLS